MTTPGDRIRDWIEGLSDSWKDRVGGWFETWLRKGLLDALEDMEPGQRAAVDAILDKFINDPRYDEDISEVLEQSKYRGHPVLLIIGIVMVIVQVIQTFISVNRPAGDVLSYEEQKIHKSFRLDPMSVITAWRRDPDKYAHLFDDLKDQGWTDERIEALKFFTLFYPSANDLVHWQAREVFEPDMVTKYGLRDELGSLQRDAFYKAGMNDEQIDNYWMAHWEHPELRTVIEMLRRTEFTEDDMREWFRLVEIPPYWRDKLIQISYEVPTRVDVRRWWDMRTIDEERLRGIYAQQGYHGKDLDDYVLWTKVYVAFPDLMARWKNGWITIDQVRSQLIGLGMPPSRVEEMIQQKIEPEAPARTTKEKDLTKTEIYKGVKKEVITWGEGLELLMDLGYDEEEADYILTINVESLTGSPHSFDEFKAITNKYRKSARVVDDQESEQLRVAAGEVVKLTKDIKVLQDAVKYEESQLTDRGPLPKEATAKLDDVRVKLHRAEAELTSARDKYDRLLAEWRHSRPE